MSIDVTFEQADGVILWTTFVDPPLPERGDYVNYLGTDYMVLRRLFTYDVVGITPDIRIILEEVP